MALRPLALLLAIVAGAMITAGSAFAQQPDTVNPTASSVQEQKLLDALKTSRDATPSVAGRISIQDPRAGNLIRPGSQDFRATHQTTLPRIGALVIVGMLALLAVFYARRGQIKISKGLSGHTVERFDSFARFNHWMTAVSFILLALSGLNLTFGRSLMLPIMGESAFSVITQAGKFVHNYVSLAFALGVIGMLVIWAKDNIPLARDIAWLKQGGGMIGDTHPPAGKFNGGQKLLFWVVILGGAGMTFTGYSLMFASGDIAGLQSMSTLHGIIGVLMVAIIFGHIYIGTLGMQGAFSAMGSGQVDVNWAREHHSIWADQVMPPPSMPPQRHAAE